MIITDTELKALLAQICGKSCWYVNAGGVGGSSFSLSIGEKIRRKHALKNPSVSEEFREYQGEATFLAWCSWRLDGPDDTLASSDESAEVVATKLRCLHGQRVRAVETISSAHDLRITFDSASVFVFCDHVPGDPSFDGNWQLEYLEHLVVVGPGFSVRDEAG